MGKIIKNQIRIQAGDWLIGIGLMLGAVVLGMILMTVIMRVDPGEDMTYFAMGTMLGGIAAAGFCILMMVGVFSLNFNLQISVGCTRKRFFIAYQIAAVAAMAVYLLILIGVYQAETLLYEKLYRGMVNEVDFLPYLLRFGIAAVIELPMVTGLCGALILRFGKKAGWSLYAVFMIVVFMGPRIAEAATDAPDTLYGRIGCAIASVVSSVPSHVWLPGSLCIALLCLIGEYLLVKRQAVTI